MTEMLYTEYVLNVSASVEPIKMISNKNDKVMANNTEDKKKEQSPRCRRHMLSLSAREKVMTSESMRKLLKEEMKKSGVLTAQGYQVVLQNFLTSDIVASHFPEECKNAEINDCEESQESFVLKKRHDSFASLSNSSLHRMSFTNSHGDGPSNPPTMRRFSACGLGEAFTAFLRGAHLEDELETRTSKNEHGLKEINDNIAPRSKDWTDKRNSGYYCYGNNISSLTRRMSS